MAPRTRKTQNNSLPKTQAELDQLIADRIATAMASYEANRNGNSGGSGGSGGLGGRDRREASNSGKLS